MRRAERAAQVRALREQGLTYRVIATRLGLSHTHAKRCGSARSYETTLRGAREAKRRRKGTCVDCGGETGYSGHGRATSERCPGCEHARRRIWTRETVIDAVQRFAREHGRPPTSTEWIRANPEEDYPPRTSVYRSSAISTAPFAKWADAIEAAGFPRPRVGYYDRSRRQAAA